MRDPISPAVLLALLVAAAANVWAAQPAERVGGSPEAVDHLSVPATNFKTALTSALSHVSDALSVASNSLSIYNDDFSLSNAIKDCVDLLELSSLELSWALSSVQTGKSNRTIDPCSDLSTWLSAVCTNQDTCMEGLEGTNASIKTALGNRLSKITSLVERAFDMVHIAPKPSSSGAHSSPRFHKRRPKKCTEQELERHHFPTWISAEDRNLLKGNAGSVPAPDVVVALDGTGNFTRIMDAVAAARDYSKSRFVVYVKKGVYHENVLIGKKKSNVMMYGDGMDATVVTGNRSVSDGSITFCTATFAVMGPGFIARDMTFQNTAGPEKQQAVAYRSDSDHSALFRCAFRGYQDTLYAHRNRQFYRECTITGTVDFIFGDATAVFQHCLILVKKGLHTQKNTVTAQGKNCSESSSGFSIQHCNISADMDLLQANTTVFSYLGRPWRKYSRTVIMESYISDVISKQGWLERQDEKYLDTLFYAEYRNSGPGADVGNRVKWPGFHVLSSSDQAMEFTVNRFICGNSWLPGTGVTYDQGLSAH